MITKTPRGHSAAVTMTGGCDSSWRTQPLAVTRDKSVVGKAQRDMNYCGRRLREGRIATRRSLPQVALPQVALPQVALPQVALPQVALPQVAAPTGGRAYSLPLTDAVPDVGRPKRSG